MSSMMKRFTLSTAIITVMALPQFATAPAFAQTSTAVAAQAASDGSDWDRARRELLRSGRSEMSGAIAEWKRLSESDAYGFSTYANFLMRHPGWPNESRMRRNAETAIALNSYSNNQVLDFFAKYPPLTNTGKARYAMALRNTGKRAEASEIAREAWRGGTMKAEDETLLIGMFSRDFTMEDHDKRMDALLWAYAKAAAGRQLGYVSPSKRALFQARYAKLTGSPNANALISGLGTKALTDPGLVEQRARAWRKGGQSSTVRNMLANRPKLTTYPLDEEEWYETLLVNARAAANDRQYSLAYRIASKVDDAFPAGTDISAQSLGVRDDYTSLTWLAGTTALWDMRQPSKAISMFSRYGNAARTAQTRSKGFYWAGVAAVEARDTATANKYFEMATEYSDHFYGQLALERLGRSVPRFASAPNITVDSAQRLAFNSKSLVRAVRDISRGGDWKTQNRFFRALVSEAETEAEHQMVADLARDIGRRDLAVILGSSARTKGIDNFQMVAFPKMPVPRGLERDWTVIHAITRQESQFAQNASSHAGAQGLMQLMPGTGREQAGKVGLSYSYSALTNDPAYNIRLGSGYFARMLRYYNGSYPLAIAAYNAGPGNVNKWLRRNGDPRTGQIDILKWVEKIPIYETRNYVQRVIENAVVYDAMEPGKANYRGSNPTSYYLGKRRPG
ncbi:lytic transglycosylase domain-containing protein [Sphingorhabdus sp. Alg239-R122]|uniref:lytic transglycosylase domain-containing protein n=1 Tax=Sphingorhabdus sp. Alg239-R122 TaxID=2305989 RepID=UPI0031F6D796